MNYLVTGGAGFIGSHLCKLLASNGDIAISIDDLSRGHKRFAGKWGPFFRADFSDTKVIREIFAKYDIDGVFHLAGFAYVAESVKNPELYLENNFKKSQDLFEEIERAQIRNIIFSSTCSVYGNVPAVRQIDEAVRCIPSNPYGESKLLAENALKKTALNYVILRYFNAAGCDSEGEIGECHEPQFHLIPLAIKAALDPKYTLHINGNDYSTPDGTCVRDYIHVEDLVYTHQKAMNYLEMNKGSITLNVGTSRGCSILEMIKLVEKVTGKKVKMKFGQRRPGDPSSLIASTSLMEKELKISAAKFKSHEQIVESMFKWILKEA